MFINENNADRHYIIAVICRTISFIFAPFFIYFLATTLFFLINSEITTATIIKLNKSWSAGKMQTEPEFKYKYKNKVYISQVKGRTNFYNFKIGDIVEIRFDTSDPKEGRINNFYHIFYMPISFLIFMLCTYGIYFFIRKKVEKIPNNLFL